MHCLRNGLESTLCIYLNVDLLFWGLGAGVLVRGRDQTDRCQGKIKQRLKYPGQDKKEGFVIPSEMKANLLL